MSWDCVYPHEFIVRKVTPEENLKLKPLNHNEGIRGFSVVAGGFAAWVAGDISTYDDIDIFYESTSTLEQEVYAGNIARVEQSGSYQFLGVKCDGVDNSNANAYKENLLKHILKGFDMPICRVGYYYNNKKNSFYCVRLLQRLNNSEIMEIAPERMKKYNNRVVKRPNSLQWLALTVCRLERLPNIENFVKNLEIIFKN